MEPGEPIHNAEDCPEGVDVCDVLIGPRPALGSGEPLRDAGRLPGNLAAVLERAAAEAASTEIVCLRAGGEPAVFSYGELRRRALGVLGGLRAHGLAAGDFLILQLDRVEEFLPVFWAAQLGGMVPAPLAVPLTYDAPSAALARFEAAREHLGGAAVVVGPERTEELARFAAERAGLTLLPLAALDGGEATPPIHHAAADDPALLLFTSGSTGIPKAVVQSHSALIARSFGTIQRHGFGPADRSFNWFPLDHVGGLVMFHLLDTCALAGQVHAPTAWVLQEPLRWLDVVQDFATTVTWAPNFAFGLLNARKEAMAQRRWDLSRVRHILNGGEAIVARTAREFLALLEPHGLRPDAMFPAWGMSETCSGVTYSDRFSRAATSDADAFVEVGRPLPGFAVRIVDDEGRIVAEGEIGQLEVSGAMVTRGYFGNPEQNEASFTADGWFRTGDNGMLSDGRLTITGRDKDVIIAHGVNHPCHEIEKVVEEVAGVAPSFAAAVGIREPGADTDQLIVFFVPSEAGTDTTAITAAIRRRVAEATGLFPRHVVGLTRDGVPKTAIGKIQRAKLRSDFEAGVFAAVTHAAGGPSPAADRTAADRTAADRTAADRTAAEAAVTEIWCAVLGLDAIGLDNQFFEIGGNSMALVQVHGELEKRFSRQFSPVELFRFPTIRSLAGFLAAGERIGPRRRASRRNSDPAGNDAIAVIGLACRFPGAPDIAAFWQNLCGGVDSISALTDADLAAAGVASRWARDPNWVKAAPTLKSIEDFDAAFFGMTVKEAQFTDPQHRIFLECCWEALEDAGYDPLAVPGTAGVFAGASLNTYFTNNVLPARRRFAADGLVDSMNFESMDGFQLMVASDKDYLPTRVSFRLNLTGPSIAVQTACSTSLIAIHMACRSLAAGDCDVALAGGSTVKVPQQSGYLYAPGMMLSRDGHCRAFDTNAAGTVFGNGVGTVVLKRLSDALADHDRIYAVVKGSAASNDGGLKVGYTAPSEDGQVRAVAEALDRAGVAPASISYVEAHGTATELGDPIEVGAVARAFREAGGTGAGWCAIGSVKTNIGHAQHASGVAGFIKAVLALWHRQLPASLHFASPNPRLDLGASPFYVPTELAEWAGPRPLRAGVNSLGIGGTNCHVILEEAPPPAPRSDDTRPAHLLVLSARSDGALDDLAACYAGRLADCPPDLGDVCATAALGRHHFAERLAVVGGDGAEIAGALADRQRQSRGHAGAAPQVAWLFTGQGAQWFGMAKELYATEPLVHGVLDRSQQVLADVLDRPLLSVMFGDEADASLLDRTDYTQPALYAVECAIAALWLSWGLKPAAVMGHSVGEYVAAHVAGVIGLDEGLRLLAARGRLMHELTGDGAMAAVSAGEATVGAAIAEIGGDLAIAAVNGPNACVISGPGAEIAACCARLGEAGVRSQPLAVSQAFHSALLDPMLEKLRALVANLSLQQPTLPLVSNLSGQITGDEVTTADYWVRHAREPVRFADGVSALSALGCTNFVEIGPKPTLLGLARGALGAAAEKTLFLPSIRPPGGELRQMLSSLGHLWTMGAAVDFAAVDRGRERRRVSLPTYPFQRQRLWIDPPGPDEHAHASDPGGSHPLLGRRIATPLADVPFETRLGRSILPWLGDHLVRDEPVLPAAAYVELALAGFAELSGATGNIELSDAVFERPLAVAETVPVQAIFSPVPDGGYRVAVHRRDDAEWVRHMTGNVRAAMTAPASSVDLEALRARCPEPVSPEAHFAAYAGRGIDYGPAFRGVVSLAIGDGRALGRIRVPAAIAADLARYRFHPALLDSCLQVVTGAYRDRSDRATLLPVAIAKATFAGGGEAELWCEAVARDTPGSVVHTADLTIFRPDGRVVATIIGLTLKAAAPARPPIDTWFYRTEWRKQPLAAPGLPADWLAGPAAAVAAARFAFSDELAAIPKVYGANISARDAVAAGFVRAALQRLGMPLEPGARFTAEELAQSLDIDAHRQQRLARFLDILVDAGQLERAGTRWIVPRQRTPLPDPDATLAALLAEGGPEDGGLTLLARCGPALADVLAGRCDPIRELIFPDGDRGAAERFYTAAPGSKAMNATLAATLAAIVARLPRGRMLSVLEIGAGTGATTEAALAVLPTDRVRYTFTDVSRAFLDPAERHFGHSPVLDYRTLDIERDPATQGYRDGEFDIVIAANVLHATRDLGETLGRVRRLLAPQGQLLLLEVTGAMPWVDIVFGLTDGWWHFADRELRPDYPLLAPPQWRRLLGEQGFAEIATLGAEDLDGPGRAAIHHQSLFVAAAPAVSPSRRWLVFADRHGTGDRVADALAAAGPPPIVVRAGAEFVAGSPREFTLDPAAPDHARRLVAALAGEYLAGIADFRPLDCGDDETGSGAEMDRRSVAGLAGPLHLIQALGAAQAVPLTLITRGAVAATDGDMATLAQTPLWGFARVVALEHPELHCRRIDLDPHDTDIPGLVAELSASSDEDQIAFRGDRLVARLAGGARADPSALTLPEAESYRLTADESADELRLESQARRAPQAGEVEIAVWATGLNFRDVLTVLGRYQGPAGALGAECAGEIVAVGAGVEDWRIGDRVMAIAEGCFARFLTIDARAAAPIPDALRYDEAATIPAAFVTAWYGLCELGRMGPGTRVLIHAATGGVGQAAIQLARHAGAEIYATASQPKWPELRRLGITRIFHSRSVDFAAGVMAATNGRGVDIVLNSLSGAFVRAGLDVLAPGGRFIEIGRNEIWTAADVAAQRADVEYHFLELGGPEFTGSRLRRIGELLTHGAIAPLPRRLYPLGDVRAAFRTMQRALHVGKLVICHPHSQRCRPDRAYLVTGGLGGLGLLTAEWLAERGARHLVLVGRHARTEAEPRVEALRAAGVQVAVETADVTDHAAMAAVLARLDVAGVPLCGVVHAAGTLDDGVLAQLDLARLHRVTAAKIAGAWNLHCLTRERPLDFFVLYASTASMFGAAGQANHAAANAFLDGLAALRRDAGLCGLSINWGPWSETGIAAELGIVKRLGEAGFGAIGNSAGLAALDRALGDPSPQQAVVPIDWRRFRAARPASPFYADFTVPDPVGIAALAAPAVPVVLMEALRSVEPADRLKRLGDTVAGLTARVIGHNQPGLVDRQVGFFDLGLDSLTAVELRILLQGALGIELPTTIAFDYPNVAALAAHLADRLFPAEPPSAPGAEIDALSGDEVAAELRRQLEELRY